MPRNPSLKYVAVICGVLVVYTLTQLLKPQVVYVDKQTNQVIKDFQLPKSNPLEPMMLQNNPESVENDAEEQEKAKLEIEQLSRAKANELKENEAKNKGANAGTDSGSGPAAAAVGAAAAAGAVANSGAGAAAAGSDKVRATFVTLARNSELKELVKAIRRVEDRFNSKFHYDWVFFNNEKFSDEFVSWTSSVVSGKSKYVTIAPEHWSYPEWVDLDKAAQSRKKLAEEGVIYGDLESYRHMCRFESGFFWQDPVMDDYDWYWRVEPGVEIHCDIDYDVFKFMQDNNKAYGFTITIHEFLKTIPTLWSHTKDFIKKHPEYLAKDNLLKFISDDNGETYNLCHFWSNFEVASVAFWRSQAYRDYFNYLDLTGGFFYERWGDAPVHSIAASLFLPKEKIHFFEDVGYSHNPYTQCPLDEKLRAERKCLCNPKDDFTFRPYACGIQYFDAMGLKKPDNWKHYSS